MQGQPSEERDCERLTVLTRTGLRRTEEVSRGLKKGALLDTAKDALKNRQRVLKQILKQFPKTLRLDLVCEPGSGTYCRLFPSDAQRPQNTIPR